MIRGIDRTGTYDAIRVGLYPVPYNLENMIFYLRIILDETKQFFFSDAELTDFINDAIRDIASISGCIRKVDPALTTVNSRLINFSGQKVAAIEYIPSTPSRATYLAKILPGQVNHVTLSDRDPGSPQYWFEYGDRIGIEPLPNTGYNLRLYIEDYPPEPLVKGSDIPALPVAFHPLIIYKALCEAYTKDRKLGPAMQMLSIFHNELGFNMVDKLSNVPDGTIDLRFD